MLSTLGLSLSMTVPSTSKGMNRVALVEFGSGCCHSDNSAKAAVRACIAAVGLAMLLVLVDVAVLARQSQRLAAREKRLKSE